MTGIQDSSTAAATELAENLPQLRAKIDAYDADIQRLLQERTEVVEHVGELKKAAGLNVFIKPGREAQIIRKLIANHQGSMQAQVLVQLWREIMMASLQVEQAFNIAVVDTVSCRELARNHFGCITPVLLADTSEAALQMVLDKQAMFAVVPDYAEDTSWLQPVCDSPAEVVFQLPVVRREGRKTAEAYVLGEVQSELTGEDTYLTLEGGQVITKSAKPDDIRNYLGRFANPSVLAAK